MLNNFKVYVINLKRDTKRLENIKNELKKQNIYNFEIIQGIDGKKIKNYQLNNLISKNNKFINPQNTNMNASEICCSLSHIKVYKKFLKTNYNYALIIEDDAIFIRNFTEDLQELIIKNFKYDKQIFFLSELWEFFKNPIDKSKNFEVVNVANVVFGHSYFINKNAANALISFNYPVKTMPDNFMVFKIYCGIKLTGLNPHLTKQNRKQFKSNIPIDNMLNNIFLIRRFVYRLINKFLRLSGQFKSHKRN